MGSNVLNVTDSLLPGRSVRVYAHCTCPRNSRYENGDVVLLMLNMRESVSTVILYNEELSFASRDVYWLQPYGEDGITSKSVMLCVLCEPSLLQAELLLCLAKEV